MWLISFFVSIVVAQDFNRIAGVFPVEHNVDPDALPQIGVNDRTMIEVSPMALDPTVSQNAEPKGESALAIINASGFYAEDESPKEITRDARLSTVTIADEDLPDGGILQSPVASLLVVNGGASEAGVEPFKPDDFQTIELNWFEGKPDSIDSSSRSTRLESIRSVEDIAAVAPEQPEKTPNDPNAPGLHVGEWFVNNPVKLEDIRPASWEGAQIKGLQEIESIQSPLTDDTSSAVTIWIVGCTGAAGFAFYLMRRLRQTAHPYDVFAQHRGTRLTSPGESNMPAWSVFGRSSPGYFPVS
eukprot:Protomagalhaensia_sp_Gyna_25__4739@NODE_466_length_3359_cov_32_696386_g360_i0_p2_GENE_NODE_466_length_3359_cov_32_696386_g360_i0NODE_466_length_3359_cov_32_696386_g360_i0_p2_ORF_typecomplete_len300_score48_02DUF5129/PF17173_4/0_051PTE/PF02126_18/0_051DUF2178/PF09946_9/2_2e03DUF2178/PF09946_9/0_85_NODE_466_length_3359_cov_32_696386_g360_i024213320